MNVELVNAFLAHETSDTSELLLKQNIQQLNAELLRVDQEKQESAKNLNLLEQKHLKLLGAFENQLSMAEFLAKQKGLEPLKKPENTEQQEQTEAMTVST